jgi:tetratricopeptide (TPR) repeat protein
MIHIKILLFTLFFWSTSCTSDNDESLKEVVGADTKAKQGLIREAIEKYQAVLKKNDRNMWAHRNLGIVYLRAKEYQTSVEHLEKALIRFENDFEANFSLAEAYRSLDKHAEAIFRYQRANIIRANNVDVLKGLAWSYYKIRYLKDSVATIQQAKKFSKEDPQILVMEARILVRSNRIPEASTVIRKAKSISDESMLPYIQSVEGDIVAATGDCSGATKIYRDALKRQPLMAGALLGLGKCLVDSDNPPMAVEYLERAVRIRPTLAEAHFYIGKALQKSSPTKAATSYKKFVSLMADDPEWRDAVSEARKNHATLSRDGSTKSRIAH